MTKLIIIAAGTGSRLMPYTKTTPKPLIKIKDNKSILELALEEVKKSKVISEVILVVGYLAEQIEAKVNEIGGIKIKTLYNPYFEVSGNLHSLWFSHHEMSGEDIMVTNADNIIDASVFKRLSKCEGMTYVVCKNDKLQEDDMKVLIEGDEVVNVSKDIKVNDGIMESVSLVKISKNKLKDFKDMLDKMVRNKEHFYDYWPTIFFELFRAGIHVRPMKIKTGQWAEIDYHGDMIDVILKKK